MREDVQTKQRPLGSFLCGTPQGHCGEPVTVEVLPASKTNVGRLPFFAAERVSPFLTVLFDGGRHGSGSGRRYANVVDYRRFRLFVSFSQHLVDVLFNRALFSQFPSDLRICVCASNFQHPEGQTISKSGCEPLVSNRQPYGGDFSPDSGQETHHG